MAACAGLGFTAERLSHSESAWALVGAPLPATHPALARQGGDQDCGPAVLTFVALSLGRDVRQWQVATLPGVSPVPWSLLDLNRAAGKLGFDAKLVTSSRIEHPGWHILHIPDRRHGGHFVAARLTEHGALQVYDPASGRLGTTNAAQIDEVWKGHALRIVGETPRDHAARAYSRVLGHANRTPGQAERAVDRGAEAADR